MIYVAHTEPTQRSNSTHDAPPSCPDAQRKASVDPHPFAQAGIRNRSLVFGPSVVRNSHSDIHLCIAGVAAVRHVNRLWYGRALVALRTYPQWTLRAEALARHAGLMEDGTCAIALGNPVQ